MEDWIAGIIIICFSSMHWILAGWIFYHGKDIGHKLWGTMAVAFGLTFTGFGISLLGIIN